MLSLKRLAAHVALLAAVSASVWAAPVYKIRSIKFTGSKHYSQEHLVAASGLKLGEAFDKTAVEQVAERLSSSGTFSNLEYKFGPSGDGIGIQFQVTDAGAFLPAVFDNLVWWSTEDLTREIQQREPLFDGSVPEAGAMINQINLVLEDLLRARGIASTVSYQMKAPRPGADIDAVVFKADLVHLPVAAVKLEGANHVPKEVLDAAVNPSLHTDYSATALQSDLYLRLKPAYSQRGYLKMEIGNTQATLEGENVDVTVPVNEGQQYRAKSVSWSGDTTQAGPGAFDGVHLRPGDIVNGEQLNQELKVVADRYGAKGYMHARIDADPAFDDAAGAVTYEFKVETGPQFVMGNYEVLGLDDASTEVLKKLWALQPGAPYDTTYIPVFLRQASTQLRTMEGHKLSTAITTRDEKVVDVTMSFEDIPRVLQRRGPSGH